MDSYKRIRTTSWATQISAVMAVVALLLVGLARPAAAKGPYPATLSGPGIDAPIDLIQTTDPMLIGQLIREMGLYAAHGEALADEPAAVDLGPRYTLTWLTPDLSGLNEEERTIDQYIYAHARLGLVVHTPEQAGLGAWGVEVIGWFVAPVGLRQTLTELGVEIRREHEPARVVGVRDDVAGPPSIQAAGPASAPPPGDPEGPALPHNASSPMVSRLGVLGVVVVAIGLAGAIGARRVLRPTVTGV